MAAAVESRDIDLENDADLVLMAGSHGAVTLLWEELLIYFLHKNFTALLPNDRMMRNSLLTK